MDYYSTESNAQIPMSVKNLAVVNVPLSAVGILLNTFFVFCMVFPPQGAEQLKPLLKVLLGLLVGCNTFIHLCNFFIVLYLLVLWEVVLDQFTLIVMLNLILNVVMYTMVTSVTCCHWKNMFYFCQIVPPQHPLLIWFKGNIRVVIYSALTLNAIFNVFGISSEVVDAVVVFKFKNALNASSEMEGKLHYSFLVNLQIISVDFWTRLVLFLFSVCVMLVSSFATVLYLWKHMKNVEESGISSPRLQRQIKMIITSITVQALLHFICSNGILLDEIFFKYYSVGLAFDGYMSYTIMSLYSFGTSINIGISQSLFRQGAVHAWQKLLQALSFVFHYINK